MNALDAEAAIVDLFADISLVTDKFVSLTLPEKQSKVAQFVEGLLHIIASDVCHGDLKPPNILWDDKRFDIADLGGSLKIAETIRKMKPKYAFAGEADKQQMQTFLNIFCAPNANPDKVAAACERCADKIQQLVKLKIFKLGRKEVIPTIRNAKKLEKLREYMRTQFLPAKSDGYASNQYTATICDYFWRCDAKNFRRACNAFDIRAAGITIYAIFTSAHAPRNEHDREYYDTLEQSLRVQKISEKAISIIRRMAEPMQNVDTSPGKEFPLPVSIAELKELKAEMLQ